MSEISWWDNNKCIQYNQWNIKVITIALELAKPSQTNQQYIWNGHILWN